MRQKKDFFARFGEKLDIPREVLPFGFSLSLSGQEELTVQGCGRILVYESERISLLVGRRTVLHVVGKKLLCVSFGAGSVTVRGDILELRFEKESGK